MSAPVPGGREAPSDPPRTLRVDLEFDGTDFEGWQRQADGRTVQAVVEAGLARILGGPHAIVGAGRTDAGVHAAGMVASFRTRRAMPAAELARALDAVLPADVGVLRVADVPAGFHAQRSALWKWYRYTVLVSRRKRPLRRRTVWRVPRAPAVERLAAAAAVLEGRHDFRSFANAGASPGGTTIRTMHALRWTRRGPLLRFDALGDGFLYRMVRTLVGTLLEAGRAGDPAQAARGILDARDRRAAGRAVPARGLRLEAVGFAGEPLPRRIPPDLRRRVDSEVRATTGGPR